MPFDALTMHCVRDELETALLDGYVEKVVRSGSLEFALQVYTRPGTGVLQFSAEPQRERVCLTQRLPRRLDVADTPFLLLLRKHARGSTIRAIQQPYLERVLRVDLEQREDGDVRTVALIVETMGQRSNAFLVDEQGVLLDAMRRVPPSRNPNRPLLPHLPYAPPPPQQGTLDPRESRLSDLLSERGVAADAVKVVQFLGGNLAGFSPQACREVTYRAFGALDVRVSDVHNWDSVASAARAISAGLETHLWSPTVAVQDGRIIAYAPYRLTHLEGAEVENVPRICEALERAVGSNHDQPARQPANVAPLMAIVNARCESVIRRAQAMRHALAGQKDPSALLTAGNALLASLGTIRPGQTAFTFDGSSYDLQPMQSPLEQAQALFRDYRKTRDAARTLPRLIERAEQELAHLEEVRTLLSLADTAETLRVLRAELAAEGLLGADALTQHERRTRKRQVPTSKPRRLMVDGFEVLAGTSARGNELVTFQIGRTNDVWLHAKGVPGAHVVIRTGGRSVPPEVLARAASLAAAYSALRESGRVEVDWTERRHVRKVPGGPAGLVTYTQQQSVFVPPSREGAV